MKEYSGVKLEEKEYKILKSLEQKLETPIKSVTYDDLYGSYSPVFYIKDGKIVHMYVSDKNGMLENFPMEILNLENLEELIVFLPLKEIPKEVFNHKSLKIVQFDGINTKYLPEGIDENNKINTFRILDSSLEKISESIKNLKSLKELWLTGNKIQILPEFIGNLSTLEKLYLSNNIIENIPESIDNLKSLKILTLSSNKINTLPNTIGNLSSLNKLFLSRNPLSFLPESLLNLKNLRELDLRETEMSKELNIIKELRKRRVRVVF